jgi:hypothetical protein
MKLLRNLPGGTLQIFLKVVPDWLMHSFFPQMTAKFKTYGSACPLFQPTLIPTT